MLLRHNEGARPQITFTSDFHELVQGDLKPGPCVLRYDPLRVITVEEGHAAQWQIRAFVRFHPGGSEWQQTLQLPAGLPLADLADMTGEGIMLTTTFDIQQGCDELEVWFSCAHPNGEVRWDTDYGKNHWLRFGLADIRFERAQVASSTAPLKASGVAVHLTNASSANASSANARDSFQLRLSTKPNIDAVTVRWRITNAPEHPRVETPLTSDALGGSDKTWSTPDGGIPIPKGGVVAFDIVYHVGGRKFTDDNQGRWYIAE